MPEQIRDGTGDSYLARVDGNNRLWTRSVSTAEQVIANVEGAAYNINTGTITLTNDAETPVIYLKNTGERDLSIEAIAVGLGATDGTANNPARITVVRNPTAGTIVSGATAVAINQNRNFGSNATLTANVYKGATGNTMTGGNDYLLLYQGLSSRLFATISTDLPRGSSIGIKIDPQTSSNTSLAVYAALICYLRDAKEK